MRGRPADNNKGACAPLLLLVCPYGIVHISALVGLLANLLPVVKVTPEVKHALAALAVGRIRLTFALRVFKFLGHG